MTKSRALVSLSLPLIAGAIAACTTTTTIITAAGDGGSSDPRSPDADTHDPGATQSDPPDAQHDPLHPDASVDAARDAGADSAGDFDATIPPNDYAKFKPAQPQLLTAGGHTLTKPKFQAITFDGDTLRDQLEAFISKLGASSYWALTTSEYGISAGTALAPVHLAESAPANTDDSTIRSWLVKKIESGAFAPPDDQTLYVVFYPATTSIALDTMHSCSDFGGYHEEAQLTNGSRVSYAILPRCSGFGQLDGVDEVTFATSHEVFEAATDALPESNPAYSGVDDDHFAWGYVFLTEGADLCVEEQVLGVKPNDLDGAFVQRTWSNAWAAAGHHPCAPNGASVPYFNAAPVQPDTMTVSVYKGQAQVTTKGVRIPVGQKRTIQLQLFSDVPTEDWSVDVIDYAGQVSKTGQELTFSLDRASGNNGDVLNLTISAVKASVDGISPFLVRSTAADGTTNFWVGAVAN